MNIDFSNLILAVVALISLISPIITTLINNHHQLKIKKIDMYETAKRKALQNFIISTEEYFSSNRDIEKLIKFNSSINELYIYFSINDSAYQLFDKLKEIIKSNDSNKTQYAINQIVMYLSNQLKKL